MTYTELKKTRTPYTRFYPSATVGAHKGHGLTVKLTVLDDNKKVSCCYEYSPHFFELHCRHIQFVLTDDATDVPTKKCIKVYIPTAVQVKQVQEPGPRSNACDVTLSAEEVALGDTLNVTCSSNNSSSALTWAIKRNNEKKYRPLDQAFRKIFNNEQQFASSSSAGGTMNTTLVITSDLLGLTVQCLMDHDRHCGAFAMKMEEERAKKVPSTGGPKTATKVIGISSGVAALFILIWVATHVCTKHWHRRIVGKNNTDDVDVKATDKSTCTKHHYESIDYFDVSPKEEPIYEEICTEMDKSNKINKMVDEYITVKPKKGAKPTIVDEYVPVYPAIKRPIAEANYVDMISKIRRNKELFESKPRQCDITADTHPLGGPSGRT